MKVVTGITLYWTFLQTSAAPWNNLVLGVGYNGLQVISVHVRQCTGVHIKMKEGDEKIKALQVKSSIFFITD